MAPHGAVGTEEVAVKAEEISAGKGGLSRIRWALSDYWPYHGDQVHIDT